jgi:hypothetical protein
MRQCRVAERQNSAAEGKRRQKQRHNGPFFGGIFDDFISKFGDFLKLNLGIFEVNLGIFEVN